MRAGQPATMINSSRSVSSAKKSARVIPSPVLSTRSSSPTKGQPLRYLPELQKFVDELELAFGIHPAVFDRLRQVNTARQR